MADLEASVSDSRAKARVIDALEAHGHAARSGRVRLAYPFTVLVEDVDAGERESLLALVRSVDPCAGLIEPTAGTLA